MFPTHHGPRRAELVCSKLGTLYCSSPVPYCIVYNPYIAKQYTPPSIATIKRNKPRHAVTSPQALSVCDDQGVTPTFSVSC